MVFALACDIGGTRIKTALIDETGRSVARAFRASPQPSAAAEIDPALWLDNFTSLAETLARDDAAAFSRIGAVAITAITRTQIFLDDRHRALMPAILWSDARAAPLIDDLRALCPPDHPESAQINAFHPLARLFWLQRERPDLARAVAQVIEPKDFINLALTGRVAGDSVSMARLSASARPGPNGRSLLDALAWPTTIAPPLAQPATILGQVSPGLPGALGELAGVPVATTGNDTWTAVLGLGALRRGFAYNISGTTEVLGLLTDRHAEAEGLLTVDWGGGLTQIGGPSQTGADALAWLASIANPPPPSAVEPASDEPLLFLPFLRGERVPYWNPDLRGAFLGLARGHGAGDLRRAVMEGIGLLNRVVLERAERAGGVATDIRMGGGGATAEWAQLKADILHRPVSVSAEDEPGLLGAAISAFVALGAHPSLDAAQEALARPAERHEPRGHQRQHYDRLFLLFKDAHAAVAPISARLAAWNRGGG